MRGDQKDAATSAAARPSSPANAVLPFGTFRFDTRTRRVLWSDSMYSIYGFQVGEVVPSLELITSHQLPGERQLWTDRFEQLLADGGPFCWRYAILDARQQQRQLVATGSCIVDDAGAVIEVRGFLVDLTETLRTYHAAEITRAVQQSAETRTTIDQAKGVMMASFDLDEQQAFDLLRLHSSYANLKLRDIASTLVERLAASDLARLPPRQRVASILGELAGGRAPTLPPPHTDTNGLPARGLRPATPSASISRIPPADLPRTLVHAVNDAAQSITIADWAAPDRPLVYVNAAFVALTGYPAEEILGRNCRFLQGADTDPEQVLAIRGLLAAGKEVRTVLRNYRKDGTAFWNEMHLSGVRDDAGRLTHYIGYQVDASERVERENQLYRLAYFDSDTGLPNRSNAEQQLATLLAAGGTIELLRIALTDDGAEDVAVGEDRAARSEVLADLARALRSAYPADVQVTRVDTDALLIFGSVGPDVLIDGMSRAAQSGATDNRAALQLSYGFAGYPRDGLTAPSLLTAAEVLAGRLG
jgi:PAS domain S-box-containing protein